MERLRPACGTEGRGRECTVKGEGQARCQLIRWRVERKGKGCRSGWVEGRGQQGGITPVPPAGRRRTGRQHSTFCAHSGTTRPSHPPAAARMQPDSLWRGREGKRSGGKRSRGQGSANGAPADRPPSSAPSHSLHALLTSTLLRQPHFLPVHHLKIASHQNRRALYTYHTRAACRYATRTLRAPSDDDDWHRTDRSSASPRRMSCDEQHVFNGTPRRGPPPTSSSKQFSAISGALQAHAPCGKARVAQHRRPESFHGLCMRTALGQSVANAGRHLCITAVHIARVARTTNRFLVIRV